MYMHLVEFEHTTEVFERTKAIHISDRAATLNGEQYSTVS
jgi:hypothetical protein